MTTQMKPRAGVLGGVTGNAAETDSLSQLSCAHGTTWNDLPEILSPSQAALMLPMCATTIRTLCKQGKFPAFKAGAHWLISRDRLRTLIEGGDLDER